jgi:hypothetical protein
VSTSKLRKAGQPVDDKPKLRPVPRTGGQPQPAPDPELRAIIEDMNRRARVQHERQTVAPDEPEAA